MDRIDMDRMGIGTIASDRAVIQSIVATNIDMYDMPVVLALTDEKCMVGNYSSGE